MADGSALAARIVGAFRAGGDTLAVAESLTGGLVAAQVVDVPGASDILRGAVVAYATDLKASLLGVDGDLLARVGAVHPEVAAQMARGVAERLGAGWGAATTGVAGPDPQDGCDPGTVYVAVVGPGVARVEQLRLEGDRASVRSGAVDAVLAVLLSAYTGS